VKAGKHIVVEGGDGTGKSTQIELLTAWLRESDIDCIVVEEPGGTPMAEAIRLLLKDKTIERDPKTNVLLFTAARVELEKTFEKLQHGAWIVSSRSYLSTIAYQGYGEGVDLAKIQLTTESWLPERYLKPDMEIVLSLADTRVNEQRLKERDAAATQADTFESRGLDFADRVQHGYDELGKQNGRHLVDASQSIEAIAEEIQALVATLLNN